MSYVGHTQIVIGKKYQLHSEVRSHCFSAFKKSRALHIMSAKSVIANFLASAQ